MSVKLFDIMQVKFQITITNIWLYVGIHSFYLNPYFEGRIRVQRKQTHPNFPMYLGKIGQQNAAA